MSFEVQFPKERSCRETEFFRDCLNEPSRPTAEGDAAYRRSSTVCGAIAAALALFTYGFVRTMMIVWQTFSDPQLSSKGGKLLMLAFIEVFDLFLLGTVLLIIGVSLYTLFVDTRMRLPGWLQANSFDDLKINLVAVVIVVMGVTFLGHVVAWDGESDLLQFGLAVSLMTAVLTLFLWVAKGARAKARQAEGQEATAAPADE